MTDFYPPADHTCSELCMCWAMGCPCDWCRPITARVDQQVIDERTNGAPAHRETEEK